MHRTEEKLAGCLSVCLSLKRQLSLPFSFPSLHTELVFCSAVAAVMVSEGKESYSLSLLLSLKWMTAEHRQFFRHRTSRHESPTAMHLLRGFSLCSL